ncbi:MAG: L-aspartate oxidase [Prochloraceae cyanobacterium]|nr:L-aspartate oxidase [Prochloraceae cyanobacterium]
MKPQPSHPITSAEIPNQFDVIVVGSGAAGLYTTLCLPEHFQVGLITKDTLKIGASDWAQGGIAAAVDPKDSPSLHLEDTLVAGAGLCERSAVKFLVENAPAAIANLVKMGVAFDRKGEKLAMTLEAAHSRPRVLHAADTTGRAIVSTLTAKVLERSNITVISQALALSLWLDPISRKTQGISLLYQNKISWVKAAAVILATGGGGQVFARTTNPEVSTGDGVALAWRAGAILRDLEFFQFHPTALTKPGAKGFLISEAVRGEGAHLVDELGNRFAFEYHPSGELAPRDVVSRAIFTHLQKTGQEQVYLDLRPIDPDRIRYRFPNIIKVCQEWGIDVFSQLLPVAPAAHYWMGGVAVDIKNRTSIPGLYAIGETVSTGVHGANRLASNSLLECIVFAAQFASIEIEPISAGSVEECKPLIEVGEDWEEEINQIKTIREELPKLVWQSAGICRTSKVMEEAIETVESWRKKLTSLNITKYLLELEPAQSIKFSSSDAESKLRICAETLNLLDIAYLMLKSALFRTESRGGHYRTDYPQTSPNWQTHTLIEGDRWRIG